MAEANSSEPMATLPFGPREGATLSVTNVISSEVLGGSATAVVCAPGGYRWVLASSHQVFLLDSQFQIIFRAGIKDQGGHEDGTCATSKFNFTSHSGACIDTSNLLCIGDSGNHRLRMLNRASNQVLTIAGTLTSGCVDGPALEAKFSFPTSLVLTALGHIMVCDSGNNRIRLFAEGMVYTVAGCGSAGSLDGPALDSQFNWPSGIQVTADGEILIADTYNHLIRYISEETVTTVAGVALQPGNRDGSVQDSTFSYPSRLSWTQSGDLLIVDMGSDSIRVMNSDSTVSTLVGIGKPLHDGPGLSVISAPVSVDSTEDGRILIADKNGLQIAAWKDQKQLDEEAAARERERLSKEAASAQTAKPATILAPAHLLATKKKSIGADSAPTMGWRPKPSVPTSASNPSSGAPPTNVSNISSDSVPPPPTDVTTLREDTQAKSESKTELEPTATHIKLTDSSFIPPPPAEESEPQQTLSESGLITLLPGDGFDPAHAPPTPAVDRTPVTPTKRRASAPSSPRAPVSTLVNSLSGSLSPRSARELGLLRSESMLSAQIAVSPEAAEIFDATDLINTVVQSSMPLSTLLSVAQADSLRVIAKQIIRNFAIVLKRYQECVLSSPTSTYLTSLIDCSAVLCQAILKLGTKVKALDLQENRTSREGLEQLCATSKAVKLGLTELESIMSARPEGSDTAGTTHGTGGVNLPADSILVPSVSALHLQQSEASFPTKVFSEVELERSGKVARWAPIRRSCGLFASPNGVVWATTTDHLVVRFEEGSMTVLAGLSGKGGYVNGPAVSAQFRFLRLCGLVEDSVGKLVIVDSGNHCIRTLSADHTIVSTFAGDARNAGFKDGPLSNCRFNTPSSIVLSPHGEYFVADTGNNRVRIIVDGIVSTFAGSGLRGALDSSALSASFRSPSGLCLSPDGDLYVADYHNHLIRKISGGFVVTIAGDGSEGHLDGEALRSKFSNPTSLVLTTNGDLIVSDYYNHCLRFVHNGRVSTFAGVPKQQGTKNGAGLEAQFVFPNELVFLPPPRVAHQSQSSSVLQSNRMASSSSSPSVSSTAIGNASPALNSGNSTSRATIARNPSDLVTTNTSTSNSSISSESGSSATTSSPMINVSLNSNSAGTTSNPTSPVTSPRLRPTAVVGSPTLQPIGGALSIPPLNLPAGSGPSSSSTAPPSATAQTARALLNSESRAMSGIGAGSSESATGSSGGSVHAAGTQSNTMALESRLVIADANSIRLMTSFSLPVHIRKGDIGLSLVQMAWEGGYRFQPQPWILEAIRSLHNTGIVIRDLWTLSSELSHVRPIIERVLNGSTVDWLTVPPRVVATVLKSFFQKLPMPLLTMELQDIWIAASQPLYDAPAKKIALLQQVVRSLPMANRILLQRLIALFCAFDDPIHIPPVWGPILLLRRSLGVFHDAIRASSRVVFTLIEHRKAIFADLELLQSPPPLWLSRINQSDDVQSLFAPFIRSLIPTHDRLLQVTRKADIREIIGHVQLMKELLFALQEQFLRSPVLHVVERHHLDRFSAYLTSFQDAWVRLAEPASLTSQPSSNLNNSSNQVHSVQFQKKDKHPVLATAHSRHTVNPESVSSGSPKSFVGSPKTTHLLQKPTNVFAENTLSISRSDSDDDIKPPPMPDDGLDQPQSHTPAHSPQGTREIPVVPSSPSKATGYVASRTTGSRPIERKPSGAFSAPADLSPLAFAVNGSELPHIGNEDENGDGTPVTLIQQVQHTQINLGRFPSPSKVNSRPGASSPKRGSRELSPAHLSSLHSHVTTTAVPGSSETPLPSPRPVIDADASAAFEGHPIQDSPTFIVPAVHGVSPAFVVPPVHGVPQALDSSDDVKQSHTGTGSHSNSNLEAREEDNLLLSLLRTTKIRGTFDRLILHALYELVLFCFSVDLAYRGAFFANPVVAQILSKSRGSLQNGIETRQFWKHLSDSPVVSWRTFKLGFARAGPAITQDGSVILKKVLDNHRSGLIAASHFAEFLTAFGPLDQCIFRLNAVYSAPWFRGYMTAPEAEHILCGAPKNSFLVRFASTHPGSFAISYSVSEDPLNPNAEFDVCHVLVERTESESGSSGFFVREGNEEPRVFSSLVELVNDWVRKHKMSSKCPQNVFEEPYCFGEISEDDAASNLELEPPGTYLLRVQPRFTLFYKSILGPMPVFGPDGVKEPSKSSSDSVGDSSNPNLVCMPGRFFLCFMLSGNRVQHEELKRDVEGRWMFGGKAHSTLSDLLNSNTALFVKPYTHLPSISPIMQDDQDDRELVLQSLLQDEEGEDGYAIDLRSAMIRPLPKTEESVAPLIAKIQSNMESPPVADVENLLDYLAKSGPDVIEKLLRPRTRRGTSIFGSIKKDFLRTDVVRLESLSLPTNRLVKMIFTLTAGDKPIRWSLQDPCKISSLSFFACTPSDGILAKGESVTIRVCVVLYKCIAMMRLLRLLIFNGDGSFQTCLPIFIRVVADVQSSILRSNDSKISDESEPYWRIPPHALTDTNLLESGTTANVFRAVLLGATVVQKRFILRQSISDPYSADLKAFETELNVLRTTRHDNIASFVGAWCDPDTNSVFIVLKYAEHGSLANFLGQADGGTIARPRSPSELLLAESTALAPSSSTQPFAPATSSPVLRRTVNSTRPSKRLSAQLDPNAVPEHPPEAQTFAFKLSMALDTARAIHYLHRHNLLHRDIKTQNLLVDAYYRVQLADFGESRSSNTSLMTMARGTPKYRAPELYTRIYNNKVDIFSLGLVMAELFGGKIPSIPGFTESSKPLAPEMSQELPTSFLALIKACCLRNPTKRPTAKQVVQILNEIRKEILDAEGHPRLSPRSRFSPFENSSNTN